MEYQTNDPKAKDSRVCVWECVVVVVAFHNDAL